MRRIRKDDPDAEDHHVQHERRSGVRGSRHRDGRAGLCLEGRRSQDAGEGRPQGCGGRQFRFAAASGGGDFLGRFDQGQSGVSDDARELEILRLLGRGDKIVEVADALEISYKTVANTTSLLKQKLGAKNHSDLVRIAVEMGLG